MAAQGQNKKTKKKPLKIEEMTKEQISQAILKKRECNAKAQTIVESLLETGITEEFFIQCLPDINQSHFEDIIEERSILLLCGYPICSKTLSQKDIPKQKYRISLKTNKVYDITTRKSFCSNSCYNSAMHVKKQLLTSPLWFREYEDMPRFHLLPLDSKGSLGQEVEFSIEKIKATPTTQTFASINDFAHASLHDMAGSQEDVESNNELTKADSKLKPNSKEQSKDIEINMENTDVNKDDIQTPSKEPNTTASVQKPNEVIEQKREETKVTQIDQTPKKKPISNPLNIVGEIFEKPERKIDPILISTPEINSKETAQITSPKTVVLSATKLAKKKQPSVIAITIEVEKCLAEWFTLDTLLFLFGEERVKEMVTDKGECIKEYLENYAKSISYTANTYDQYQALCKKLNMLELEDRRYDAQALTRKTKPLPDYSIIKEESKKMQLKVKSFFAGETEISGPDSCEEEKTPEGACGVTQLPLVDKNAQNALRRRIVCEHLNKVLPDLLRSLGLLTLSVSSDVRLIVNTFNLKANNIMFKPLQWTLIAIIILKLLSLRDARLNCLLKKPMAYQHMQLLLLSYEQDGGYLERLISWLTDIDRLLDTNDTQLTIE